MSLESAVDQDGNTDVDANHRCSLGVAASLLCCSRGAKVAARCLVLDFRGTGSWKALVFKR